MSTDAASSPPTPGAQPERTALAWQRTALAAATGAAVVGRLALADLGPVAVVVMTASLVMALAAFVLGRRIARMIAAEPAEAPLSDAAIAARMAEEGVDIARRTVAKYREGMKIPSSWRRRRVGVRKGAGGH